MSAEVMDNVIQRFETDVAKAVADLKAYATAQDEAGRAGDALAGASGRAGGAHDRHALSIKGLVREQRTEQRMAGFLMREFAFLGIQANESTKAMIALGVGAASGTLGLTAAIEVVKLAVVQYEKWVESSERVEAAHRKVSAAQDKAAADVETWLRSLSKGDVSAWAAKFTEEVQGAFQKLGESPDVKLETMNKKEVEAIRGGTPAIIAALEARLAAVQAEFDKALAGRRYDPGAEALMEKIRRDIEVLRALQTQVMAPAHQVFGVRPQAEAAVASTTAADKAKTAREAQEKEAQRVITEAQKVGLDARELAEWEYTDTLKKLDAKDHEARLAAYQVFQGKLADIDEKERTKEFERLKKHGEEARAAAVREADAQYDARDAALKHLADRETLAAQKLLVAGNEQAATELAAVEEKYDKLLAAELLSEDERNALIAAKAQERNEILARADEERTKKANEETQKRMQMVLNEAMQVANVFIGVWMQAWSRAGTVNRNYQREYSTLWRERRAQELLEMGVVEDVTEGRAIAAQEQAAAEAQKTAEEKQGIADRMAALALEWGVRAIAEAAGQNWGAAAAYAAAAAAATALAFKFHGEAQSVSNSRGYTAEERNTLEQMRAEAAGTPQNTATGTTTPVREYVILLGNVELWETPAEAARRLQRGLQYVKTLDLGRAEA